MAEPNWTKVDEKQVHFKIASTNNGGGGGGNSGGNEGNEGGSTQQSGLNTKKILIGIGLALVLYFGYKKIAKKG